MRYGQLVVGPAGSGKSTYCNTIYQHGLVIKRNVKVINLDPAADHFNYPCYADVRDLISVADVIEDPELRLGPNGALVFCMEYLAEHQEWLQEVLGDVDSDYILFDFPGQIELYTHCNAVKHLVTMLTGLNFKLCMVFLLDTQFLLDIPKFLSGSLVALSTMVNFSLPHVNVLSKIDLLGESDRQRIEAFIETDPYLIDGMKNVDRFSIKYRRLTSALNSVLEDYSLIRYVPFDYTDEESIGDLMLIIDDTLQYSEDAEVRDNLEQYEADD